MLSIRNGEDACEKSQIDRQCITEKKRKKCVVGTNRVQKTIWRILTKEMFAEVRIRNGCLYDWTGFYDRGEEAKRYFGCATNGR